MNISDFVIDENGRLTEYSGCGGAVVIPNGVKVIDAYVFNYMDTIETLVLPDSIEAIDESNFEECENLRYNEWGGAKYLGNEENPYLVLISAKEGLTELAVKEGCRIVFGNALANNEKLSRLSLPQSLKHIGFMAFYSCTSLCELALPEGVEHIDACAFYDTGIERLVLPEGLKFIGFDAFSTVSLGEVILPSGIQHIGNGAFTHNDIKFNEYMGGYYIGSESEPYLCFMKPCDGDVAELSLHESTRLIYSSAFSKCAKLKSVKLPEGLMEIGQKAFEECEALGSIIIPESVTLIGENAFSCCYELKDVKLPSGRVELESCAFLACRSIESIELGEAIIGDNAFEGCEGLKSFTAGAGSNLYGDYIFSECTALEEVTLPKKLENYFTAKEFEDSEIVSIKYV